MNHGIKLHVMLSGHFQPQIQARNKFFKLWFLQHGKIHNRSCGISPYNFGRYNTIQYQLQTDRIVKEFNEELVRRLMLHVSENQWDWDQHINTVLFAYRTAIN